MGAKHRQRRQKRRVGEITPRHAFAAFQPELEDQVHGARKDRHKEVVRRHQRRPSAQGEDNGQNPIAAQMVRHRKKRHGKRGQPFDQHRLSKQKPDHEQGDPPPDPPPLHGLRSPFGGFTGSGQPRDRPEQFPCPPIRFAKHRVRHHPSSFGAPIIRPPFRKSLSFRAPRDGNLPTFLCPFPDPSSRLAASPVAAGALLAASVEARKKEKRPFWLVAVRARMACVGWWTVTGSNRRPPACKAGALPAELTVQKKENGDP